MEYRFHRLKRIYGRAPAERRTKMLKHLQVFKSATQEKPNSRLPAGSKNQLIYDNRKQIRENSKKPPIRDKQKAALMDSSL